MSDRGRIITHHDPKPIPDRRFDWCAYREGYEGPTQYSDGSYESHGDPVGWGKTEAEAVIDLKNAEELHGIEYEGEFVMDFAKTLLIIAGVIACVGLLSLLILARRALL